MNTYEEALKKRLAEVSGTKSKDWFLVSRARHGMQLVFSAITANKGSGEVITQAFTCITAVNPILAAGLTPVYGDISEDTLSLDTSHIGKLVTATTRAVVVQHTFGATADVAKVRAAVPNREVLVIEDSAHCLGVIAKHNGEPVADVSIHSFGAEKLLSSRFGGAVWINPRLRKTPVGVEVVRLFEHLPDMSFVSAVQVQAYPLLNAIGNRLPLPLANAFRAVLTGVGLFVSPIMPSERSGQNFGRPERLSPKIAKQLLGYMNDYESVCKHRTEIARVYAEGLQTTNAAVPKAVIAKNLPYVRFPLVMRSPEQANAVFERLKNKGMQPGKWYRPVLFPGANNTAAYAYNGKKCPVTEDISQRIINLPTGPGVTVAKAKDIIREVNA